MFIFFRQEEEEEEGLGLMPKGSKNLDNCYAFSYSSAGIALRSQVIEQYLYFFRFENIAATDCAEKLS